MPLTDKAVKNAKCQDKDYKLADSEGLFLLVKTNGGKYWRLKYRFAGKEKLLAIGVYPKVTLSQARYGDPRNPELIGRQQAKDMLARNIDPGAVRKIKKAANLEAAENSFQAVGLEWFSKQKPTWAEKHWTKVQWMLEKNLFPWLGARPMSEITPPELLAVLRRIESQGAIETAKRTKQVAGQVFRFAVATGRAERDPSQDLKGALATSPKQHLAAVY